MHTELELVNLKGRDNFERSRHRWDDNISMDLTETEYEGMVWIHLAKIRDQWQILVNMAIKKIFTSQNECE
jgi:hypothetical protein